MTAYVIADIEIHNAEKYPEYIAQITPTVSACGGRYLVRGASTEVVSGAWQPQRMVIMEFPSLQIAQHWVYCEEYASIHALRNRYAKTNMIIVEGSVDFTPSYFAHMPPNPIKSIL